MESVGSGVRMPRKSNPEGRKHETPADGGSLIDWHEPDANTHVLDWRARAQAFGLGSLEQPQPEVRPWPNRPNNSSRKRSPRRSRSSTSARVPKKQAQAEDASEAPEAGLPADEVDLVRMYFSHIGRRRLLKAKEEREICERIEAARADLVGALGAIPGARHTFVSLAEEVRKGASPAAELILLPDGGELTSAKVSPVLEAFARIRRAERRVAGLEEEQ